MKSIVTIIQCRMGSARLPGKALKLVAQRPILTLLVERLRRSKRHGQLVLATTHLAEDDAIADFGRNAGITVIRGSEYNLLARYKMAMDQYPSDFVVRVTGDNPFTDPTLMDQMITHIEHNNSDYIYAPDAPVGTGVDVFSRKAMRKMAAKSLTDYQREHVNADILDNPDDYSIENFGMDASVGRPDIRLTVDTEDDLRMANIIAARLDNCVTAGIPELLSACDHSGD
jgi:spore coat polysaccharide biosynthesis protein SpsF